MWDEISVAPREVLTGEHSLEGCEWPALSQFLKANVKRQLSFGASTKRDAKWDVVYGVNFPGKSLQQQAVLLFRA